MLFVTELAESITSDGPTCGWLTSDKWEHIPTSLSSVISRKLLSAFFYLEPRRFEKNSEGGSWLRYHLIKNRSLQMFTIVSQKWTWVSWERNCQGVADWFKRLNLESDLDVDSFLLSFFPLGFLGRMRGRTITQKGDMVWQKLITYIHFFPFKRMTTCCQQHTPIWSMGQSTRVAGNHCTPIYLCFMPFALLFKWLFFSVYCHFFKNLWKVQTVINWAAEEVLAPVVPVDHCGHDQGRGPCSAHSAVCGHSRAWPQWTCSFRVFFLSFWSEILQGVRLKM